VAVEIEGVHVCWATTVEADSGTAEVLEQTVPGDLLSVKRLGAVRYGPIRLTCGSTIDASLFAWMQQMVSGGQRAKNGALISVDAYGGHVIDRLDFTNALMTGLTLPALDASSRQAGQFAIELTPEQVQLTAPKVSYQWMSRLPDHWQVANFQVTIAGLDCTMVVQVDALPISIEMQQQAVGAQRIAPLVPSRIEIPDLSLSLAPPAADFTQWHEDFAIHQTGGSQHEKHGQLDYLGNTLHDVLFSVTFDQLGIHKLTRSYDSSGPRVRASMYCGRMQLVPGTVGRQPAAGTKDAPKSRVLLQHEALAAARAASPGAATITRVRAEGIGDVRELEAADIQAGMAPPYVPIGPLDR
jgi:hypothetical protein